MHRTDIFFHFNASINLRRLIERNVVKNLEPTAGYLTNAFGVLIDPKFVPQFLHGREGTVEGVPIPANWHADMAEFGAVLRAVELAGDSFAMIELGCGWGCWMNIAGVVARRRGLKVHLIGVEGDEGHLGFAREALSANGFTPAAYDLHRAIASAAEGVALFPNQKRPGLSWGLEPMFDLQPEHAASLMNSGRYDQLPQLPLERIAPDIPRIDLLHVDIQGGEAKLIPACLSYLSDRVAYMVVGTHSRQIEGLLFDCLLTAGWVLEVERPAFLALGDKPAVSVDGVQGWRNPRLLPVVGAADSDGYLKILSETKTMRADEVSEFEVEVSNDSGVDWLSRGDNPVHISYHWHDPDGAVAIFDGERTKLPDLELPSGRTKRQRMRIIAPARAGIYQLTVTLVQEGVRWFEPPDFIGDTLSVTVAAGR